MRLAAKVFGRFDVTGTAVDRCLRIGAERQRSIGDIVGQVRSNNFVGSHAGFHPAIEGHNDIVLCIELRGKSLIGSAKAGGARTASTMMHPRNQEEPGKVGHFAGVFLRSIAARAAHHIDHRSIVLDRAHRRNGMVRPAVIQDQFPAMSFESREVGIDRVFIRGEWFELCEILVEIELLDGIICRSENEIAHELILKFPG